MLSSLITLLAPPRSLLGTQGAWITEDERLLLRGAQPSLQDAPALRRRGMQSLDILAAAGSYDATPLLKEALKRLKYRRVRALVGELAALMLRAAALLPPRDHMTLCPVPLHWMRRFDRGFNQAFLLARAVGELKEWPVCDALVRLRPTGRQAHRSRTERVTALASAFCCDAAVLLPPTVILVDDVATTAATLDACARALKERGVREVLGLVVALG